MKAKEQKDGICSLIMYTLFPSSSIGLSHEVKLLEKDIEKLNADLAEERILFANNARIYKQLKNNKIPMADPSITRVDAIKDVLGKLKSSRTRIKLLEKKINVHQLYRDAIESSQLHADMDNTIQNINYRMRKVKSIDPERMVRNMDEIADNTKELHNAHDIVNDALISGWSVDVDVSEIELEEYLKSMDEEDLNLEKTDNDKVEDELDLIEEEKVLETPKQKTKQPALLF